MTHDSGQDPAVRKTGRGRPNPAAPAGARGEAADTAAGGDTPVPGAEAAERLASRLHSAAIHLLRRLRSEDAATGLTAPRLSALSVLVFGGPRSIGQLAAAEQVRPPTISRLVRDLERDGLVEREGVAGDARVQRVRATAAGEEILRRGRQRRVARLSDALAALPEADRAALERALPLLEQLARPAGEGGHGEPGAGVGGEPGAAEAAGDP